MIKIRDWQTYALNLNKYDLVRFFGLNINLTDNIVNKSVQLDRKSLLNSFMNWVRTHIPRNSTGIIDFYYGKNNL